MLIKPRAMLALPTRFVIQRRSYTGPHPHRPLPLFRNPHARRSGVYVGAAALTVGGSYWVYRNQSAVQPDPILNRPNPADQNALEQIPTSRLVGGWIVYAFCSSPTFIEASETLFNVLHRIPLISNLVDAFARRTFFSQFFTAENAKDAERMAWRPLRANSIGVLVAYNIEADHDGSHIPEAMLKETVERTLETIEAVGRFGKECSTTGDVARGDTRCWVRTKLTGLVPNAHELEKASAVILNRRTGSAYYPGVPEGGDWEAMFADDSLDQRQLSILHDRLRSFMLAAQRYGVRFIIDAEQTWYQPAIDVFTEKLMAEFNSGNGPPIVCATFQAYLRRNAELIKTQMERAQAGEYKLIFKQVRGAYMPEERKTWTAKKRRGHSPVFDTKAETDESYNQGIKLGIEAIERKALDAAAPDVAAIYATHNEVSVDLAIKSLVETGLGERKKDGSVEISDFTASRIAFAQIYGMKDNLTNRIARELWCNSGLPIVCKSAAHGSLEHALPNLSRRAAENKTIMEGRGGASDERKRLGRELRRRYLPFGG